MIDPNMLLDAERELYEMGYDHAEARMMAPVMLRSSLSDADACRQSGQHHRQSFWSGGDPYSSPCPNCGHD